MRLLDKLLGLTDLRARAEDIRQHLSEASLEELLEVADLVARGSVGRKDTPKPPKLKKNGEVAKKPGPPKGFWAKKKRGPKPGQKGTNTLIGMQTVMQGQFAMSGEDVLEAMRKQGFQSNSTDPMNYIRYLLSSRSQPGEGQLFLRGDRRGTYTLRPQPAPVVTAPRNAIVHLQSSAVEETVRDILGEAPQKARDLVSKSSIAIGVEVTTGQVRAALNKLRNAGTVDARGKVKSAREWFLR